MSIQQRYDPGAYNTDILDCCEDGASCCDVLFCPWCMNAQLYNAITTGERNTMHKGMCVATMALDLFMVGFAFMMASYCTRQQLKAKYALRDNADGCCIQGCLCAPCSACQLYRELSLRHEWPGGICCIGEAFEHPNGIRAPQSVAMGGAGSRRGSSAAAGGLQHAPNNAV
jgi:Cys-rich protein (TIGR01571 family)